jgi:hypothetical protein
MRDEEKLEARTLLDGVCHVEQAAAERENFELAALLASVG